MNAANASRLQGALTEAYRVLFVSDLDYAYSASKTTPEQLAERMTKAACAGTANTTGPGFRNACKALGIPHTGKAVGAFLEREAPAKPVTQPRKDTKSYMLPASRIESLMSGAVAAFASGDNVVLKYTDGTSESAECPEQAAAIRAYAKDSRREAPAFFAIVSAVQAKRQPATP